MPAVYLTPREVAERWGCAPETVQRLCRSGELPAMRLADRGWRISPDALAAYEAAHTSGSVSRVSPESQRSEPVRTAPAIGPLPEGYEPRFPELWNLPPREKPASSGGKAARR